MKARLFRPPLWHHRCGRRSAALPDPRLGARPQLNAAPWRQTATVPAALSRTMAFLAPNSTSIRTVTRRILGLRSSPSQSVHRRYSCGAKNSVPIRCVACTLKAGTSRCGRSGAVRLSRRRAAQGRPAPADGRRVDQSYLPNGVLIDGSPDWSESADLIGDSRSPCSAGITRARDSACGFALARASASASQPRRSLPKVHLRDRSWCRESMFRRACPIPRMRRFAPLRESSSGALSKRLHTQRLKGPEPEPLRPHPIIRRTRS